MSGGIGPAPSEESHTDARGHQKADGGRIEGDADPVDPKAFLLCHDEGGEPGAPGERADDGDVEQAQEAELNLRRRQRELLAGGRRCALV